MTVQYQLTEPEIVQGMLKIRRNSSNGTGTAVLSAAFGLLLILYSRHHSALRPGMYFWAGCVALGVAAYGLVFMPLFLRAAMTKSVRTNPVFTDLQETTFDEFGLKFSSPSFKQEVAWTTYKKLMQDEHYIYLHSGLYGLFTILPKRAFDDVSLTEFLRCSRSLQQA